MSPISLQIKERENILLQLPDPSPRSEAEEIVDAIVSVPLEIETSKALLPFSVDLGLAYGITVYDAIYVSLAKIHQTILVTADKKLVEIITTTIHN